MPKKNSFKQELQKILSEEELKKLKTAFDVIGDIAILEIDVELRHKEKEIGETLLSMHKNINTVLRKESDHRGKLRRQKMKFLAGEDKRLAFHKENNTSIYVDVEKVYFSPRLSTERKRIMQQVKDGENILVMFSGAGPYPFVLSKNTKAKKITGIELNPAGYNLALKNKKLNKAKNVDLYKGDVNKILPFLIKKPIIGLKSNWRKHHLKEKLPFKPQLLEIYIAEGDLENRRKEFEKSISAISKGNFEIVLHCPLKYKNLEVCISSGVKEITDNTIECFSYLENLCKKYKLTGFVGHPYSYLRKERDFKINNYKNTKTNIISFFQNNKFNYLMLENLMWGPFSSPNTIIKIAKKFSLNLCIDLPHLYSACRSEDDFYDSFKKFPASTYFHIADSKYLGSGKKLAYQEHSFPVDEGKINFDMVLPLIKKGIAEVINKDELNPVEMVESWKKLNHTAEKLNKFDRILMPLPKSAEDFLPVALDASKKDTIIHFYDFLHEDDFHLAEEKISKACKKKGVKYKKIAFSKCGQHSPRTFRICLDFMVE